MIVEAKSRSYRIKSMMRYAHINESLLHGKLNGTCEHQKLPICLEPTFRLLPWQSGSLSINNILSIFILMTNIF